MGGGGNEEILSLTFLPSVFLSFYTVSLAPTVRFVSFFSPAFYFSMPTWAQLSRPSYFLPCGAFIKPFLRLSTLISFSFSRGRFNVSVQVCVSVCFVEACHGRSVTQLADLQELDWSPHAIKRRHIIHTLTWTNQNMPTCFIHCMRTYADMHVFW